MIDTTNKLPIEWLEGKPIDRKKAKPLTNRGFPSMPASVVPEEIKLKDGEPNYFFKKRPESNEPDQPTSGE